MKKPKTKSPKKTDLKIISLPKKIKLPKVKKIGIDSHKQKAVVLFSSLKSGLKAPTSFSLGIKFDKKISLKILAGVLFFFLSQFALSIVMFLTLPNLYQSGTNIETVVLIFNIIQLILIAASGFVVGWLIGQKGLIWGAVCGFAITVAIFAFSFLPGNPIPSSLFERLVNALGNGVFIIILTAVGGKAGQAFYLKRHPKTSI